MKIEKLLPEVYFRESRDFSYIGRLLEIVFNYMKTAGESVSSSPLLSTCDSNVMKLASDSLGFKIIHKYDKKNLSAVLSIFSHLLRNKGSRDAINSAVNILLTAQKKIVQEDSYGDKFIIDSADEKKIIIQIPDGVQDVILLEDLFDYILPAGMLYEFQIIEISDNIYGTEINPVGTYLSPYDIIYPGTELSNVNPISLGNDDSPYLGEINTSTVPQADSQV